MRASILVFAPDPRNLRTGPARHVDKRYMSRYLINCDMSKLSLIKMAPLLRNQIVSVTSCSLPTDSGS